MAFQSPRTVSKDAPFETLDQPNGSFVDAYNFTDGLTHAQWPTVQFFTQPLGAGTNVTASVAKDITSETITSATHKDPTGSSGVWRKSQGRYRVRVQPLASLALGVYYMRVTFSPSATATYSEDHEFEVISPGDATFGGEGVSPDEVTAGLSTSLTDEEIEALIVEATNKVSGWLLLKQVDVDTLTELPDLVRDAIILYTRWLIFTRDASAGLGHFRTIREQDKSITFGTSSDAYVESLKSDAWESILNYLNRGKIRTPSLTVTRKRHDSGGSGIDLTDFSGADE
jgi:hypothetical protein